MKEYFNSASINESVEKVGFVVNNYPLRLPLTQEGKPLGYHLSPPHEGVNTH